LNEKKKCADRDSQLIVMCAYINVVEQIFCAKFQFEVFLSIGAEFMGGIYLDSKVIIIKVAEWLFREI